MSIEAEAAVQENELPRNRIAIFNLFSNEGSQKEGALYRVYQKGGAYEDVVADYVVSAIGVDHPPSGTAKKDKSQAGNPVIRLNVGVGSPKHYYRGTLNFNELANNAFKSGEAQATGTKPGVFGTVSDKDGVELDVAGWVKKTKNGKFFLSCVLQEPYKKDQKANQPHAAQNGTEEGSDDIPF
jgi:hypothetical protein